MITKIKLNSDTYYSLWYADKTYRFEMKGDKILFFNNVKAALDYANKMQLDVDEETIEIDCNKAMKKEIDETEYENLRLFLDAANDMDSCMEYGILNEKYRQNIFCEIYLKIRNARFKLQLDENEQNAMKELIESSMDVYRIALQNI